MTRKDPETLPVLAQITAQTHIAMLKTELPGLLDSYYVTGSAALGDFHAGKSDVDFIALTSHRLLPDGIDKLKTLHRMLVNKGILAGLDGVYIAIEDLFGGAQPQCLRFNEGKYQGVKVFGMNSPDAWALKQYGICLYGRKPNELPYEVDWNSLRQGMLRNLNTYWQGWVKGCRGRQPILTLGLFLKPDMAEWGVLGISRLYFSFHEQDVTSKTGAGEYALQALPERWHMVLREALRIRNGSGASQYSSAIRRRTDALKYMEFILEECNAWANNISQKIPPVKAT